MILYLIILLVFLSLMYAFRPQKASFNKIVQIMVTQASRWSIASLSDKNPFISNLHANYGVGYLMAMRSFASDSEIKAATGVDIIKFENEVVNAQRKASQKLMKTCPGIIPMESPYLTMYSQQEY